MPQIKSMPLLQTKAIDDRTVTTLFSTAGVVDFVDDRMVKGAFAKTIEGRAAKVLHLWAHDGMPPIAVIDRLYEVPRAELPKSIQDEYPDATGGCIAQSTFIDSPRGNEVLQAIKAGAPLEASFGYDVLQAAFTTEGGKKIRNIKEVRLYEISTCQFGANSATISGVKSLAIPSAAKLRRALHAIKAMDGMGSYEVWDEAYDMYGAAAALQAIGMLLAEETDNAAQFAQLSGAMRLLLAFMAGELDECDALMAAGTPADMGMMTASRMLPNVKMLLKVGARNATHDQKMIDAMHDLVLELGATNCAGTVTSGDKSRADAPTGVSLTQLKSKLAYLDFAIKE